ncbi:MAG: transcription antitermination factor NusB [Candidatus Niyogibacteria bacterium]|nr:transcription antitermination factor NusB [Candidatus Niyogibacteria bacterium]
MAHRHLSRSIVLQTLFEWDFNDQDDKKIPAILERNIKEFAPGFEDNGFTAALMEGILKKRKQLDDIIEKAAPEWPIEQVALIDRNVLRIGLFELLFGNREEAPPKVAINEAIELAKSFGGDSSGKFVNGVLGTVYREIGEPGKDETNKKKSDFLPKDADNFPIENLAGAVVCRKDGDKTFFALVHDFFGYWTLSKGHLEKDENAETGALREVKKELGLKDLKIKAELGQNEYIASDPEKGPIRKNVAYFLAFTPEIELKLSSGGGLDDAKWFEYEEIAELKIYGDIRKLLDKANDILIKT